MIPFLQLNVPVLAQLGTVFLFFLLFDLFEPRGQRHRWREYLFLTGAAGMTALFGLLVDQITLGISRDYFTLGKGIPGGPTLTRQVAQLGLHAGVGAGVLGGGLVLLVNRAPRHTFRLFHFLWVPLLAAAVCGAFAGGLLYLLPWYIHPLAAEFLEPAAAHRFTIVWFIHVGVYAGGAAGLIYLVRLAWRNRETTT